MQRLFVVLSQNISMKKLVVTGLMIFVVLLGSVGLSESADLQKGYATALRELKPLAKQGDADAQFNLGVMYENGRGVPQNYKTAVKWYTLAAKQGNINAQFNLGSMYAQGLGVIQDYKTAMKWYTLAAKQGDADAQFNLGLAYHNGQGVIQDHKTAVKWYTLAAKQGNINAQSNLGAMYDRGLGVAQDYVYAHSWFNIAASSGNKLAINNRNIIAKKMTPNQLARAQDLARNFVPNKSSPAVIAKKSPPSSKKTVPPKSGSTGSGFFVSKLGHVITNAHVVRNCGRITVGDNAKKQVTVTLLETDKRNDLALLKISSTQMASVETKSLISKLGLKLVPTASEGLLRSDDVELGEDVLVSGYPYGEIYSNTIKVTKGIVSANRGIGDDTGQFQMDAAVQPGNSGGPIYDENGNIVGVVVAQLNKLKFAKAIGSLPENVNFGIKASTVRQFLTSSGLPTKWSNRSHSMSTKELAKIAKNQTVMVVCRR
jgi:S1-C subfamily serine protease